jgi:recombination associated protein RdgC
VTGAPPDDLRNVYETRIRHHAFSGFEENDEREEAAGWVAADDWFDVDLFPDRWLIDDQIVLTLRTDVRKVPSRILRHECAKLEAEWKERHQRDRLSRAEREEVKQLVTRKLAARVLPSIRGTDVAWDLKRGEVLFFGCGNAANETFRILFEKTFQVKLKPLFPYALAVKGAGEKSAGKLDGLGAALFAPGRGR